MYIESQIAYLNTCFLDLRVAALPKNHQLIKLKFDSTSLSLPLFHGDLPEFHMFFGGVKSHSGGFDLKNDVGLSLKNGQMWLRFKKWQLVLWFLMACDLSWAIPGQWPLVNPCLEVSSHLCEFDSLKLEAMVEPSRPMYVQMIKACGIVTWQMWS